ncbi:hypothetical protein LTS12_028267, partial [Elasticomyces elasticus]
MGPEYTHWVVPLVFAFLIAIANYGIYMATIDYMVASYGVYSASATGGNGFARDLLAGLSAMYATPMYSNIGGRFHLQWASTILAILAIFVTIPIYVFYWMGPRIRASSKFAQTLEKDRQRSTTRRASHHSDPPNKYPQYPLDPNAGGTPGSLRAETPPKSRCILSVTPRRHEGDARNESVAAGVINVAFWMVSLIQIDNISTCLLLLLLLRYLNRTDVPKIKGLPEIPGVPIFGNLLQLGDKHATVTGKWAKQYGPVFQVRMGNRRIVFANSFDSVRQLWIKDQSALVSRPTFHTFHSVVSSSQGFTIGTSPWDESCKRRRKAAATALNRPAVQSYMPIIDLESTMSIKELLRDSENGTMDVNPTAYFQRFALNTSLTLNYGFRIAGNVNDELLQEIVVVERGVSNFRSTSNNWQDYIPLM